MRVSRRRRFRDRLGVFARRELVLGVLERRRGHERGKGLDPPRALAVRVALLEQPRGHVAALRIGAEVVPVTSGSGTLKDAINDAMRDWVASVEDTYYCIGSNSMGFFLEFIQSSSA